MKQIIIATGNAHKAEEFGQLMGDLSIQVESASICGGMPEVEETGSTFAANAQLKAEALRESAPKGSWVLADDSGLQVDALDGEPGIYSARYAGPDASDSANVDKLLVALADVENEKRSARFVCALCLIDPEGQAHHFEGACEGHITRAPSGSSGFGYDPVFVPLGYDKSFAELGEGIKGELSHRAKAVQSMIKSKLLT